MFFCYWLTQIVLNKGPLSGFCYSLVTNLEVPAVFLKQLRMATPLATMGTTESA